MSSFVKMPQPATSEGASSRCFKETNASRQATKCTGKQARSQVNGCESISHNKLWGTGTWQRSVTPSPPPPPPPTTSPSPPPPRFHFCPGSDFWPSPPLAAPAACLLLSVRHLVLSSLDAAVLARWLLLASTTVNTQVGVALSHRGSARARAFHACATTSTSAPATFTFSRHRTRQNIAGQSRVSVLGE